MKIIKKKMKGRHPIQIQYMVDHIGVLILIFCLKLSIGPPYYQGDAFDWSRSLKCIIEMNYTHERHTLHSQITCAQNLALGRMIQPVQPNLSVHGWMIRPLSLKLYVHLGMIRYYPGWSGSGTFWTYFLIKIKGFCEWDRMIRTYARWSGPGNFFECV